MPTLKQFAEATNTVPRKRWKEVYQDVKAQSEIAAADKSDLLTLDPSEIKDGMKYYRLTILECETPTWVRHDDYRGRMETDPHPWAIGTKDPKADWVHFEGRVLGRDPVDYENYDPNQRFQRQVKIGLSNADIGKSVIVEVPKDSDAIPQRVGILARGAHFSPAYVYGLPTNRPTARVEGDENKGIVKCSMRPLYDKDEWAFKDGILAYERLHA